MRAEDSDVKMRLLSAAKRLFAKQGYDGTSVRQICEEAEANIALVSYYFGGKENMFQALFETFFSHTRISEFVVKEIHDPVDGVKLIIREALLFQVRDPEMVSVLQQEISLNSPRTDIIGKYAHPVWIALRELLRKGREEGVFRFRSLNHALVTVIGMVVFHKQAHFITPILEDELPDVEAFIEDTIGFVLRGLQFEEDKNGH